MKKKIIPIFVIVLFCFSSIVPMAAQNTIVIANNSNQEDIIYVDDDNTEGPWDGSMEHPYNIIQYAIENASNGDTVFVFSGIYSDYFSENYACVKITKSINLVGEDKNTTIYR